ncbi:carbon starvation CstA family protein [Aureibacter tunicatorum]|uniref:Carbon starvation protein n=1 Tax=Aureibacter tunicatorum TaxID=866807 RepID=A0AAE3XKG4_9BACT|nr:carbon starvation protein A [Aureibacter tunicatorum]MDR6239466.1 carbon starvation protein [Aureibacter tunicatorum]BDD04612.1 carbon starvation protein A [Aureibacter tunicatorum]
MLVIFLISVTLFGLAYRFYGRFLEKIFDVDKNNITPSHCDYDGVDRVPTKLSVLFGHHFSSIAGAGPIVGPIIAGLAFGWLPALLWIVLGSIFIGGVHDYASLMASIRHRANSVAEIAKECMSPMAYKLMLLFIWLALVYILVVFVDLTATSFANTPAVASSSSVFILLAVVFGLLVFRKGMSLGKMSFIFVPLLFLGIGFGMIYPLPIEGIASQLGLSSIQFWSCLLLLYCLMASILPVWALLQPRDYLSSFLLYGAILGAFIGLLIGDFEMSYPAFTDWTTLDQRSLFPILFITVACGACSGFHSLVASGTTSKQLDKETDAKPVAYGAMLVEGGLAVLALFTVVMISKDSALTSASPLAIFGSGMGNFLNALGLPHKMGETFGILAVSTFLLTTLDTSTRLGRYIFEEFFSLKGSDNGMLIASFATLAMPAIFVFVQLTDASGNPIPAWKAIWPVFGATNQMLAAIALLVVYVWLRREGKPTWFIALPLIFMLSMTLWAIVQLIYSTPSTMVAGIASILLLMAIVLVVEAIRSMRRLALSNV